MRTSWLKAATLGLFLSLGSVQAQPKYPAKPIRLIVPAAPGGGADIVARVMAQKLTESFGVAVVVDNRSGGGGTIGTETAVRATPDGYTMISVVATYAANAALYKLPYDAVNDVTPTALIGETGFMATLHPSIPVKSIKELIAYDGANPGKLNYGTGGSGSAIHLVTEFFNQATGARLTHVPYKGLGPALNDLLGGQIQIVFGSMPAMIPLVKANRLRGIAVTASRRSPAVPDIPPVAESVPGYEAVNWYAILGPKALPKDIVTRWNGEINRILKLPDVMGRMANDGMDPVGGSPERFREVLKRDVTKWQNVVMVANIKPGN